MTVISLLASIGMGWLADSRLRCAGLGKAAILGEGDHIVANQWPLFPLVALWSKLGV